MEGRLLMVPGPTNISAKVREIMSEPQIGHTDADFVKEFPETLQLARRAFKNSKGYQYVFTGTGTVGMEAAVAATVEEGDRVLVINTGYFGQRMADINKCYGARVEELTFPFGGAADPDSVRRMLTKEKFKALYVTHVDTGSSACNPIGEVVSEAKKAGVMAIVDGVCSVGGIELDFDRMGADLAFTGSQKALAAPPGAVLIAVSASFQALLEAKRGRIKTYYANLLNWKTVMDEPKMYFATHAVQVLRALRQALREVDAEGLEARWRRHASNAKTIREGVEEKGFKLVAEANFRADTVSGIWTPDDAAPEIQMRLRDKHKMDVARGLKENGPKMIRVGHLGNLTEKEARSFVKAFGESVKGLGA